MTAANAAKRIRILLIEDDPDDRFLIQEMLTDHGSDAMVPVKLECADDLKSGITRIRQGGIDIVLLDLSLPDSRGMETLRMLMAEESRLPIIVMTALNDEAMAVEAVGEGAQDYLVKGQVNKTYFIRSLRYAIERHRIKKELDATKAHMEQLAMVDPLTGLLNRRGLQQVLSEHVPRSSGDGTNNLAILVDLDDFKKINDALGHAVGDVVLSEITRKLRGALRATDYAARIGGDEFMVLLPHTKLAEGVKIAEKIRMAMGESPIILTSGKSIRVTASFGLVPISHGTPTLDELLRETHLALSNSKRGGKNKVSYERRGRPKDKDEERILDLSDIRVKLRRMDGFMAFMQSIYRLSDLHCMGYEFLSRSVIDHFRMPDDFFRVSMENNILTVVDRQCLKTCVAASVHLNKDMHCHMNLFPSTMMEIPIRQLLAEFPENRTKDTYCIEISEQQIIGDPSYLAKPVEEIKRSGMLVAIDDVGFGRSCLENLILLEPDIIKIDKRCVKGIARDSGRARSLKRILNVAKVLDTEVVAEGIESQEDLDMLKDLGVIYGQGFFLDKPAAAEHFLAATN